MALCSWVEKQPKTKLRLMMLAGWGAAIVVFLIQSWYYPGS